MANIKVALIEDDPEIRQLMQLLIDGSPSFECKQVYADVATALADLPKHTIDVLLMDIDLPGMTGIEGVGVLKRQAFKGAIIMLSVHEDDEAVFDSLCAGAIGYLVKGLPPVQLLAAIEDAHQGGAPMSPHIARRVIQTFQRPQNHSLTNREKEVLEHLCEGENYRSIAEKLFISANTVKAHIKNIYEKLQVNTRAAAVKKAIQQKIVK